MNNLISNINFKGEWIFNYELPLITQLHLGFYISNKDIEEEYEKEVALLKGGKISVSVADQIDFDPDPSIEQLNSLGYIQSNEYLILENIHNCLINEVIPNSHYLGENKTPIDSDFNMYNLRKHLAIATIHVYRNSKENFAYYYLSFYFNGYNDEEWIKFLFHKDRIIGFEYSDFKLLIEKDSETLYYELDMSNIEAMTNLSTLLPENEKYFKPLLKYNKLKPWQAWYNEFALEKLFDNSNFQEFKEAFDSGQVDPNFYCPYRGMSIINRACIKNKPIYVEFLLNKKADTNHTMLYANSKEIIKLLIKHGVDINVYLPWQTTKLGDAIKFLFYQIDSPEYYKKLEWVKFLINNGGDLNNCDKSKSNYLELLNKYYSSEEIKEKGIVDIINQL